MAPVPDPESLRISERLPFSYEVVHKFLQVAAAHGAALEVAEEYLEDCARRGKPPNPAAISYLR